MLKITDLIIDPRSLGSKFWLVSIDPAYSYQNGQRTSEISGYRYTVALPEKNLEKVGIKIPGKQLLDAPENGYMEVTFTGLELYFYWQNGQPNIAAKATGVSLANTKN